MDCKLILLILFIVIHLINLIYSFDEALELESFTKKLAQSYPQLIVVQTLSSQGFHYIKIKFIYF